jgi:hypothetical protein
MADGQNTAAIVGLLKGVAPILTAAMGPAGPLAAVALSFLSSKLGVPVDKVQETIAGMTPDQMIQMKQLDNDFVLHCKQNDIQLDLEQIKLNEEEAKVAQGTDKWWVQLWVGGWRPYIGWICGTAIGYQFLARPLLNGFTALFHLASGAPFPALEVQDLIALVTTMLGHSALRSLDKKNGINVE